MTACIFLFVASASAVDISVSICLYLFKASSVICKDSSCFDNVYIIYSSGTIRITRNRLSLFYFLFSSF